MAMRRVSLISRHLVAAPTAAAVGVGEEVRQILEALGPNPIETTSKAMKSFFLKKNMHGYEIAKIDL